MKAGFHSTFVISWSQTETDGIRAAPLDRLSVGATWRWTGRPVRVDGSQDVLVLSDAVGMQQLRKRAARVAQRLIGGAAITPVTGNGTEPDLPGQCFVVTDGQRAFVINVLPASDSPAPLLMVKGPLPPADCDLWIVQVAIDRSLALPNPTDTGGVICFTPGTSLATPTGPRLIDDLRPGDPILTRDNGPQTVLWRGQNRISGARLHAMPHLRPIRFRTGAMGTDRPARDLLVSPQHRMLVKGPAALALFNTDEVLVAAQDLINDRTITLDYSLRAVTYIHILLDRHNVIWANGLETESFHPARASHGSLEQAGRQGLLAAMPQLADPHSYGEDARRNLTPPEAAILQHDPRR
jgi:hypothetical protein